MADEPRGAVEGEPHAVIAPGQEALLAEMLGKGAALPHDCKLTDGKIEYTFVRATYACRGGEVILELVHPSQGASPSAQTDRFAIVLVSGSPPDGLIDGLVERISSREEAFQWTMLGGAASKTWPSALVGALAGVLAIGVLVWRLRRRASLRRGVASQSE
jgi:hypothetical protein